MRIILFILFVISTSYTSAQGLVNPDNVSLPYTKVVFDNGLHLIVHEDHKAPIVLSDGTPEGLQSVTNLKGIQRLRSFIQEIH